MKYDIEDLQSQPTADRYSCLVIVEGCGPEGKRFTFTTHFWAYRDRDGWWKAEDLDMALASVESFDGDEIPYCRTDETHIQEACKQVRKNLEPLSAALQKRYG